MVMEYLRKIYTQSVNNFYQLADEMIKKGKKAIVVTANPEILSMGLKCKNINNILLTEDTIIVPDGIGVVKAIEWKCKKKM